MIQLTPKTRPSQLTDQIFEELTALFYSDKSKKVWKEPYIKAALLEMSNNKCCYCECNLAKESNYVEVEHFRCKSKYPHLVVYWGNLLPSCKRCNSSKGDHDVEKEPIVHPVEDSPGTDLYLQGYRFYGKTEKGQSTIRILNLNDRVRLQRSRFEIGSQVKECLDSLREQIQEIQYPNSSNERARIRISRGFLSLLQQGLPQEEYAATVATELLNEPSYEFIKSQMVVWQLWSDDFEHIEQQLKSIALFRHAEK